MSVCLSVCLSAHISQKSHFQTSQNFLYMSPVAVSHFVSSPLTTVQYVTRITSVFAYLGDHITPVLQQLHWLSVRQRVEFKLAVLVYKALNNLALPYLSDDCQLVATSGHCQLRSSDNFKCTIICTGSCLGDRAFTAAGPRLWNCLPTHVRSRSRARRYLFR